MVFLYCSSWGQIQVSVIAIGDRLPPSEPYLGSQEIMHYYKNTEITLASVFLDFKIYFSTL